MITCFLAAFRHMCGAQTKDDEGCDKEKSFPFFRAQTLQIELHFSNFKAERY